MTHRFLIRSCAVASLLLISACIVTGPKTEKKHALNLLNGETYNVSSAGASDSVVLPILTKKQRASRVTGRVQIGGDLAQIPLRFVPVGLYDSAKKLVTQATSDSNGEFGINCN